MATTSIISSPLLPVIVSAAAPTLIVYVPDPTVAFSKSITPPPLSAVRVAAPSFLVADEASKLTIDAFAVAPSLTTRISPVASPVIESVPNVTLN